MDQELIAYLDAHFRETSRQIVDLREETVQQISSLRQETVQQISSLREETNRNFAQVDARFEQVDARFERGEATARQTVVLVEGLRHEVHLIAEAFLAVSDKLDLYRNESRLSIDDVRGWMEVPFRELDNRVRYLEGRKEQRYEDVMDDVRRVLGKPPLRPPVSSD